MPKLRVTFFVLALSPTHLQSIVDTYAQFGYSVGVEHIDTTIGITLSRPLINYIITIIMSMFAPFLSLVNSVLPFVSVLSGLIRYDTHPQ